MGSDGINGMWQLFFSIDYWGYWFLFKMRNMGTSLLWSPLPFVWISTFLPSINISALPHVFVFQTRQNEVVIPLYHDAPPFLPVQRDPKVVKPPPLAGMISCVLWVTPFCCPPLSPGELGLLWAWGLLRWWQFPPLGTGLGLCKYHLDFIRP